jgi:hypothetical protein
MGTIYIGGKLSEMDFIKDDFIGMIQFIETRKKGECTNRGKRDPADFPLRICFTRIRTGILQSASLEKPNHTTHTNLACTSITGKYLWRFLENTVAVRVWTR